MADMKEGLTSSRPKMSILPRAPKIYGTRGLEYGADKYARGNYHGPPPEGVKPYERFLGYIDALMRHADAISDAVNHAIGSGASEEQINETIRNCVDDKASSIFPASGLPHIAHMRSCVDLAIATAVDDGILPEDPGRPWDPQGREALPQKDGAQ